MSQGEPKTQHCGQRGPREIDISAKWANAEPTASLDFPQEGKNTLRHKNFNILNE